MGGRALAATVAPVCLALFAAAILGCEQPEVESSTAAPESPSRLVVSRRSCSSPLPSPERGIRLEREGNMRMERYPYDPRDGVRGALLLFEAADCYRAAGLQVDSIRSEAAASRFQAVLQSDYASARVAIERAISKKRWSDARKQAQRLLALTGHLQPSAYVDWLRATAALASSHDESLR